MPTDTFINRSLKKLGVKEGKDIPLPDEKPIDPKPVEIGKPVVLNSDLNLKEKFWYQWLPKGIDISKVLLKDTIAGKVIEIFKIIKGESMGSISTAMAGGPKTFLLGVASLIAIIANVVSLLFDGDPATNPDWSVVIPAATAALGVLFARDANKTSEQAGAGH